MQGPFIKDEIKNLLFVIGHLLLVLFFGVVLASVFYQVILFLTGRPVEEVGSQILFSGALNIVVLIYAYKVTGYSPCHLFGNNDYRGWRQMKLLISGAAFGIISIMAIVIMSLFFDIYAVRLNEDFFKGTDAVNIALLFGLVAMSEELIYRGFIIKVARRYFSRGLAIIWSALFFSLTHALNEGIVSLAFVNIFLTGVVLGEIMVRTGSLWGPVGFHFSWNFVEGLFFSLPVSGLSVEGFLQVELTGENGANYYWWGGAFGPEGSLVTTGVLLLMIFIIFVRRLWDGIDKFLRK